MIAPGPQVTVVIPNWNGLAWLDPCLNSLAAGELVPAEVIVVDNGSTDGSREYLSAERPEVRVIPLRWNTGFAHAANQGLAAASHELVALVNSDVIVTADWLARMASVLAGEPRAASVACKMLSLEDPGIVYDAGDVLRRDGVCEQRGRFGVDDGRWDDPGPVFGACAGAALYRREIVLALGGFDERYFAYLEDVDLALRLRLAGWSCRYEPAVVMHAGGASSDHLAGGHAALVTRNTVLLIAKAFPLAWLPYVAYRQLAWSWHAARERRLRPHLRALWSSLPLLPSAVAARGAMKRDARVQIEAVVPRAPFRGARALGHPSGHAQGSAGR